MCGLIQTKYEEKEKQAKKLDNETLAQRAKESQSEKTSVRNAVTTINANIKLIHLKDKR